MNKKLLTAAMAAAIVAPTLVSADTTVYGRINNTLTYKNWGQNNTQNDGQWDVESNASRFGFKGSEDLGNGLKGLFQLEMAVDTANGLGNSDANVSTRLGWVGLSGGFGTAAIGRQWTPYYGSVNKTDIFQMAGMNNYTLLGTLKTILNADNDNDNNIDDTSGRTGDAVAYISPDFSGFSAKVAAVMAAENDVPNLNNENVDVAMVSLDYNNGPLSIGIGTQFFGGDNDKDDYDDFSNLDDTVYGVGAKYTFADTVALIGQYESYDGDQYAYALAAEYYFGNNTLRGVYAYMDTDDTGPDDDYTSYGIELQHAFSKRTRIYASYYDSDLLGTSASTNSFGFQSEDGNKFGVGVRHDF